MIINVDLTNDVDSLIRITHYE